MGLVCEWRPFIGIGLQIFDSLGLAYSALEGMSLFEHYRAEGKQDWELIFGSARRKGEIEDFRTRLESETYEIAVMITPSEVEEEIWFRSGFWAQGWLCDSAKFGDVLAGSWNVYVKSPSKYTSLDFNVHGRMMSSPRRVFHDNGLNFLENPHGATCIRPIEKSIGKTIAIKRWNGEKRLIPDAQIPPYSRKSAVVAEYG